MRRDRYLLAITANAATIGRAAAARPDVPVPSCPQWRHRDLAFHVGSTMCVWAQVVHNASVDPPAPGAGVPPCPDDGDLDRFVRAGAAQLLDALRHVADDAPAWNWWGDPTVRGIPRRAALEVAVHAWDATVTDGSPIRIDRELAADGIGEFFEVMMPFTGRPPTDLRGILRLDASDTRRTWLVDIDDVRLPAVRPSADVGSAGDDVGDATMRGRAEDLLLVLWRRLPADAVNIAGDTELVRRFLAYPRLEGVPAQYTE